MKITVSLYAYTMVCAFLLGFGFVGISLKKRGVPGRIIFYSLFLNLVTTLYGAKAYTVIVSGFRVSWFWAGISGLGAACGLLAGVFLFSLIYGEHKKLFFRLYALAIPGMYGVSKFGCFTAGCCRGIPYDGPFCVYYANQTVQAGPLFPVQLVESIAFLLLFLTGAVLYRKKETDAVVGGVIFFCAAFKFSLEYLREEHIGVLLSANQIVCIGFAIWALTMVFCKKKIPPSP